jgi:enoyl-CoA hydratase
VPGWGGSQRLPRIVGLRRGLDLFFSARWIDAATARSGAWSTTWSSPTSWARRAGYCTQISTRSRGGLAIMKRLARQGMDQPLGGGLKLEEDGRAAELMDDDVSEGLAAFEARRPPVFKP